MALPEPFFFLLINFYPLPASMVKALMRELTLGWLWFPSKQCCITGSWVIEHYWLQGLGVTIIRPHIRWQQTEAAKTAYFHHTHTDILSPTCSMIASLSTVFASTWFCSPYLARCQYRQLFAPLGAWGSIDIQLKPTALSGVRGVTHELCMHWRHGAELHQCHHNWNNWKDNTRWVNN